MDNTTPNVVILKGRPSVSILIAPDRERAEIGASDYADC